MGDMSEFQWAMAALVGILATARLTRLVVEDEYPPTDCLRRKWDKLTGQNGWNKLLHCAFCASFYVGGIVIAAALITDFSAAWWVACSLLGGSYIAAIVVASDWG